MTEKDPIKSAMKSALKRGFDPYNSHEAMAKAYKAHERTRAQKGK